MRRWPFGVLLLGLALQVAAWALVIPTHSTYDEFDHVFRASSVWHGQLTALADPPAGYPTAVIADRDLVESGAMECMRLPYTSTTRCNPGPDARDGTVVVTSGAALYNPLYYLLVSPATALGHGVDTVMWMRLWSGLITFAVLGWALSLAAGWPRPDRAVRGVILAASPMLTISMAVVAPNGLEIASGLLWWVALVALSRADRPGARVWVPLVVAGCLLATLRSLGPLFLLVSLLTVLVWRGPRLRAVWRRNKRAVVGAATVIACCLAFSVVWVLTQHLQAFEPEPQFPEIGVAEGFWQMVKQSPAVVTLFIAAIPARNLAPPQLAVAAWLVPFVLLLVNLDRTKRRAIWALGCLVTFVVVFPLLFGAVTFHNFGFAWQSRYILPLAIGIPLLAALNGRQAPARVAVNDTVTVLGVAIAQLAVIRFGQDWYDENSPFVRVLHVFPWVSDPVSLLVAAVGVLLTGVALFGSRTGEAAPGGVAETVSPTGARSAEGPAPAAEAPDRDPTPAH